MQDAAKGNVESEKEGKMADHEVPVPGHMTLGPRGLSSHAGVVLAFTPDTGLIQVTADGFNQQPSSLVPRRPGGNNGPPTPPIPQDVRIEVGLLPPGSSLPVVTKVFRRSQVFSDDDHTPLKYAVPARWARRTWRCTFRNIGRTEIRCFGRLDFVAERVMSPIPWLPNALAPVFWGYNDLAPLSGQFKEAQSTLITISSEPPTPMRVLFPTLDGSPQHANILQIEHQYPLVVLCHGNCQDDPNHYLDWGRSIIAAQLARAGYVVVVPHLPGISGTLPPVESNSDLELVQHVITWMRTEWAHSDVLAPSPHNAILGHSWGALLAGRLAAGGGFQAHTSMSGEWADWFDSLGSVLPEIQVAGLYIYGSSAGFDVSQLPESQWSELVHKPRHRALVDQMSHFDYLPAGVTPCDPNRGPCPHAKNMIADIVTMFMARYAPPPTVPDLPSKISATLVPPYLQLTLEQEFYAGGYLNGFTALAGDPPECRVALTYETPTGSGSISER